jgi:hypothetical protein
MTFKVKVLVKGTSGKQMTVVYKVKYCKNEKQAYDAVTKYLREGKSDGIVVDVIPFKNPVVEHMYTSIDGKRVD